MAENEPPSNDIFRQLVQANHILHYHNVLDAYGHISVRNPQNADTFFMSREQAPALVSCREDLEEYRVSDASPVNPHAAKGYSERFIHSEILKRYKGVQAVVHAHSEAILPYTIVDIPLRPVLHISASIGAHVPIYDTADHYDETDEHHTLLVNNEHLGAALAACFHSTVASSRTVAPAENEEPSHTSAADPDLPQHQTVLMRGHGISCIGGSIEEVVYRAIYACVNARVQTVALQMQGTYNQSRPGDLAPKSIHYISDRELRDTRIMHSGTRGRTWGLWCKEVASSSLYKNQLLDH